MKEHADPPTSSTLPDYVRRNRVQWDECAREYEAAGGRGWVQEEPDWGIWGVAESQLKVLLDDLAGKDAIELGCWTAYVSSGDPLPIRIATRRNPNLD